jgi:hypothetical protein
MTLFLAKVLFDTHNGTVDIPHGTFLDQESQISINPENRSYGEMASYNAFLAQHTQLLEHRFRALLNVLDELRRASKI